MMGEEEVTEVGVAGSDCCSNEKMKPGNNWNSDGRMRGRER